MKFKVMLIILCMTALFIISACSNENVGYEGSSLKVAVIGDVPDIHSEKLDFNQVTLETLKADAKKISKQFDGILITPSMFEKASNDSLIAVYQNLEIPIVFFNSEKRHVPFLNGGITYETADGATLQNGAHTTVYMPHLNENSEDVWYFYLKDDKNIDSLYKEIFEKVATL
ncbi:hypothetical protein [Kurthia massiliensis]|uniref:hypothetical protein n=1 Tax=Kurthia massiliensis TaxID=1033739 RepID=UPI000289912C|nr:hypothetical protein [Kurthia massiliensis]